MHGGSAQNSRVSRREGEWKTNIVTMSHNVYFATWILVLKMVSHTPPNGGVLAHTPINCYSTIMTLAFDAIVCICWLRTIAQHSSIAHNMHSVCIFVDTLLLYSFIWLFHSLAVKRFAFSRIWLFRIPFPCLVPHCPFFIWQCPVLLFLYMFFLSTILIYEHFVN